MDDSRRHTRARYLETRGGGRYRLPMFLPVYEHRAPFIGIGELVGDFAVEGIITNAFFLYKRREIRDMLLGGSNIKDYYGFNGLVVTDSGAFQGFQRPLYLSNRKIIDFQQSIGADVVSPLDLVTTPGEKRVDAKKKMESTLRRIKEGMRICDRSMLVGVQQGGRYLDLRNEALDALVEMGTEYVALGSLVPFFNRNHDLGFVSEVLASARKIVPWNVPIHIYGAGDPVEIPFYAALGADIFDSSSFAHYAKEGWYMTPYGAVKDRRMLDEMGELCLSPYIEDAEKADEKTIARHNLYIIMLTLARIRKALTDGDMDKLLDEILTNHAAFFPESRLKPSLDKFAEML